MAKFVVNIKNWKILMINHNFAIFDKEIGKLTNDVTNAIGSGNFVKNKEITKFYNSMIKTLSDMQKNKKSFSQDNFKKKSNVALFFSMSNDMV